MKPDISSILIGVGFLTYGIVSAMLYKKYHRDRKNEIHGLDFKNLNRQQILDKFDNKSHVYKVVFYASTALSFVGTATFMIISQTPIANEEPRALSTGIFIGAETIAGLTPTLGSFLGLKISADRTKNLADTTPIGAAI